MMNSTINLLFGKPKGMANIYRLLKKIQRPLMSIMMRKMMSFYHHMNVIEHFDVSGKLQKLKQSYDVFVTGADQV